jgi:uncharacterized membrane protein
VANLQASWTVEIDAPRERVFAVAADVPNSPSWQPSLNAVTTLETDDEGRSTLVDTEADAKVKTTKQRLRFSYEEPDGMTWVQEKGDLNSLEGSWEFTELDGGRTNAVYALQADPGRMLGLLLRGPAEGKVKEFLTKGAAEGLKRRVESESE